VVPELLSDDALWVAPCNGGVLSRGYFFLIDNDGAPSPFSHAKTGRTPTLSMAFFGFCNFTFIFVGAVWQIGCQTLGQVTNTCWFYNIS
jgi:hypothetical protein